METAHQDDNDDGKDSWAAKAAEVELQRRVDLLEDELREATDALNRLRDSGKLSVEGSSSELSSQSSGKGIVQTPTEKRGYLFKWLDRSIGWGGTKWALRFVVLEKGRIAYYGSHTETAPRYVMTLRGCAVRDDGWKRNRRHTSAVRGEDPPFDEAGAYFFLLSIYQRSEYPKGRDESEAVALLRFSTPSQAEKAQWIQRISEACAYCETDAFLDEEAKREDEMRRQQQTAENMAQAMPEAKDGTLPPLYFAPAKRKAARRPSGSKAPKASLFRTKSKNFDADKMDARSTKGYPPSKPMHRAAAPSYLSPSAPVQNYRGFFNLGIILLVLSNFRLMLGTIQLHGFVVGKLVDHVKHIRDLPRHPWEEFPFISGVLLQFLFVAIAFSLEWLLSRKKINESIGMILHHSNAHAALCVTIGIVWTSSYNPALGAILLVHGTITWMKILSYVLANEDYRCSNKEGDIDVHKATLALVEDLDEEEREIVYPQNVTLRNIFYFWCCPSLTYQIAFPRSPRVRTWKIVGILARMVIVTSLFTFLLAQVVGPALELLVADLEATNGTYTLTMLANYWLKLSLANTYLWLLMFYAYFHLFLNLVAEILRFGDRVFYKDWWNSGEVGAYWRLWNMPVHYWLIRHVYFPCIRLKVSRNGSTLIVFLLSAVMHELLVSVPFHMIRPWSFLGMLMQLPLVAVTKYLYRRYPGSSIGNVIFWISFCIVGQPAAVLLYTVDYQFAQSRAGTIDQFAQEECRIMWRDQCLIR